MSSAALNAWAQDGFWLVVKVFIIHQLGK